MSYWIKREHLLLMIKLVTNTKLQQSALLDALLARYHKYVYSIGIGNWPNVKDFHVFNHEISLCVLGSIG